MHHKTASNFILLSCLFLCFFFLAVRFRLWVWIWVGVSGDNDKLYKRKTVVPERVGINELHLAFSSTHISYFSYFFILLFILFSFSSRSMFHSPHLLYMPCLSIFFPGPFVCLGWIDSIQFNSVQFSSMQCSFRNQLELKKNKLAYRPPSNTTHSLPSSLSSSVDSLNSNMLLNDFIIFFLLLPFYMQRRKWLLVRNLSWRSVDKITEGVSNFLFQMICVRRRRRHKRYNFFFKWTSLCSISFVNWRRLKMEASVLTSMYTSLLGLKVLLTICRETLMWGIEWSRWMIIDFSICMMLTASLHTGFSRFRLDTQIHKRCEEGEKKTLFVVGSFKIRGSELRQKTFA